MKVMPNYEYKGVHPKHRENPNQNFFTKLQSIINNNPEENLKPIKLSERRVQKS